MRGALRVALLAHPAATLGCAATASGGGPVSPSGGVPQAGAAEAGLTGDVAPGAGAAGVGAGAGGAIRSPRAPLVHRRLVAMGTWLELELVGPDRERTLAASEEAVRAVERVEARLSTWTEDSELARLNRAPTGDPIRLSPELARDLARARELWSASGGAFDPGIGALVEAWDLRSGGRRPTEDELARARAGSGLEHLALEVSTAETAHDAPVESNGRAPGATWATRRHADLRIEEGAFGKGVGLDAAAAALNGAGIEAGLVDLGGQVLVLGDATVLREAQDADGEGAALATLAVADPRDRSRRVLELRVPSGSLATTANSERGIVVDGVRRSHVLDPRTGRPCPDFGSVTVWAPDGVTADALSTGLYVLGPEAALAWAAEHPGIEVVVIEVLADGLLARASAGWRGRIDAIASDLVLSLDDSGLSPRAPYLHER